MKICFISGCLARSGGTERVGSIIANGLVGRGYDVYILSMWDRGAPHFHLEKKIKVYNLLSPRKEGKLYRTYIYPIIKLHSFLKKNKIDIVIDIDTELSVYTYFAIIGTECKWISWEHFNYWAMIERREKKRFIAKKLIKKKANHLIVLTDEDKKKHMEKYGMDDNFIISIHNPSPEIKEIKYNFDLHSFISVGRLSYQKGYDLLIEAWKIFEKENKEWKLMIIGDGEEKENLIRKIKEYNLNNLKLLGFKDNVEDFYRKSSCYVLSSRYEGFPMVILEAESNGLPIIAFDCKTGPKDLVDLNNGFLLECLDPNLLAEAMLEFTKSEKNAEIKSQNSILKAKENNLNEILNKWELLFDNMMITQGESNEDRTYTKCKA